jgi:two-component system response regulator MprA
MNPVLFIEDNPDLRDVVGLALQKDGFEVELAANGREALKILRRRLPFVILLDLMMPVMNGWEFLLLMKKDRLVADIPIIVCSAARDQSLKGVEYLRKPLDLSRLLYVVHRYFDASNIVQR